MPTTPQNPDLPHGVVGEPTGGPPRVSERDLERLAERRAVEEGKPEAGRQPWWRFWRRTSESD